MGAPANVDGRPQDTEVISWMEIVSAERKAARARRRIAAIRAITAVLVIIRPAAFTIAGLTCFVIAAAMLSTVAGLVTAGISLLVLDWLSGSDRT